VVLIKSRRLVSELEDWVIKLYFPDDAEGKSIQRKCWRLLISWSSRFTASRGTS
jgi:hypothetical protein